MTNLLEKICNACGTYYKTSEVKDNRCLICEDDRQYVPQTGQAWTTPEALQLSRSVQVKKVSPDLYELTIMPAFAIGQRAFLILTESGNILWDCIPLLDEGIRAFIQSKGGLRAIAISHPHYYSNMQTWASTFNCPVYIHEKDKMWLPGGKDINLWSGEEIELWSGIKIINTGGHFPGSCILYVPFLSRLGTLFAGDSLFISKSQRHISIMYSYPNVIPLPRNEIQRIWQLLQKYKFDKMYGAFSFQNLTHKVQNILKRSMEINIGRN